MTLSNTFFNYELSTKITFGVNTVEKLPEKIRDINGSRVLIVTDPGIKSSGILSNVLKIMDDSSLKYKTYSEVDREPDIDTINQIVQLIQSFNADIIVGIGGGSALDAAKASSVMSNNQGDIINYAGLNKIPNSGLPTICIPTTAGTGSEVTIWTVISDKKNKKKIGIGGEMVAPTIAICDPKLTLTLPASLTASTGMDALTHALESFVNTATQPISETLSRESMKLISTHLRNATHQKNNLEARSNMLLASTIAATAFNPTRLGLSHALCMPLGADFQVPHGIANAILLPRVMEYNMVGNLEKFKEIAEIFGENTRNLPLRESAELAIKAVKQLSKDIGISSGLKEFGVTENDLDYIAENSINNDNVLVNPRTAAVEDLKEIVKNSL